MRGAPRYAQWADVKVLRQYFSHGRNGKREFNQPVHYRGMGIEDLRNLKLSPPGRKSVQVQSIAAWYWIHGYFPDHKYGTLEFYEALLERAFGNPVALGRKIAKVDQQAALALIPEPIYLEATLQTIDDREYNIMLQRMEGKTVQQIGDNLGLTQQRITQIIQQCLRRNLRRLKCEDKYPLQEIHRRLRSAKGRQSLKFTIRPPIGS